MNSFSTIQNKLEHFIRRYYTNELIKGAILFFAFGLLYFLATLFVEYILWLSPLGRTVLFWFFIAVELLLFIRYIAIPLLKLSSLQKGIDYERASKIIGNHFPEVKDKLLNVLQLNNYSTQSDLVLASIEQKSRSLKPIPFQRAVSFKSSLKYLKYTAIPISIVLFTYLTGKEAWFNTSYERVINYQTAYEPPAPFEFFVINENLEAIEGQTYKLQVSVVGEVIPENVQIRFDDQTYFLQQLDKDKFGFDFKGLKSDVTFEMFANDVVSRPYKLKVLKVPSLEFFEMQLNYPTYTGKKDEIIKSGGSATIPEGTKVTWKVKAKSTTQVNLYSKDTLAFKQNSENEFEAKRQIFSNYDYDLSTSNDNLNDYERLAYSLKIIKDAAPELNLKSEIDSLDRQSLYFYGQVSDDYGLRNLNLVYYPSENPERVERISIPITKSNYSEFISAFPNDLNLKEGVGYELYFEVFDNDQINGFKRTQSPVFNYRKLTQDEKEKQELKQQNETIKNMGETFEKLKKQDEQLKEFSKTQKEKESLNFNDKKKFESFLKRQKQQEELMKSFNKNLQENLEEFQKENKEKDPFKEDLKERLKENEKQLEEDEKLLKELEEMQEKIDKEDFSQKLDELAKQNKNKQRSMKQLLELTKRYYVSKKAEKLVNELDKISKEQEELSEKKTEENNPEAQQKLNDKFEDLQKELDEMRKENNGLQKPMPLPEDKLTEQRIKEDQNEAKENLEKGQEEQSAEEKKTAKEKAKKKQKSAAAKMKKMSKNLAQMMPSGGGQGAAGSQMEEDAEMLRQILDNLLLFSFDQEKLMNLFKGIDIDNNQYGKYIVKQSTLRTHFEHVDDSLFVLSLRQPKLSENVNKQISEVYFNIDKALGQLSENRLYQGVSAQQYTITASNELASFLSDILDSMDAQLNPMPGSGSGGEMQLPDIIKSQEDLNKEMEEGMKEGEKGNKPDGEKEGEQGKEGEKGQKGQQGENSEGQKEGSQEGSSGAEGEQSGKSGNKGQDGKDSEQEGNNEKIGYGEGGSEEMNEQLYKIYKQQQQIRQALENKIRENEEGPVDIKNLIEKMEEVELDLLNKGFTNETLQKMMDLQHQLMKMDNATFMQGQEEERESETNRREFEGSVNRLEKAKSYFNRTEVLNRQALPLNDGLKVKVQEYFKRVND